MSISGVIKKLNSKTDLNKEDLLVIVHDFTEKKVNDEDIKSLVIAWREKGETSLELKELVDILFSRQKQLDTYKDTIDLCGTGGDKLNTFNISTLSAIVASSCGAKVIKHSGRSTTSISGSVDILGKFGLNIDISNEVKERCFKQTSLMFIGSKILRDIFGSVKEICKNIDMPGFVNLLGPLTNPYKTSYHLLGVSKTEWGNLLAAALKLQDSKKEALIVCSKISENLCMDELSFCGRNYVWRLTRGEIKKEIIEVEDLGHKLINPEELVICNIDEGKTVFESVLKGNLANQDSRADVVALNVGAALYLANKVKSIASGYEFALRQIHSGKAWEHFQGFMNCNKE